MPDELMIERDPSALETPAAPVEDTAPAEGSVKEAAAAFEERASGEPSPAPTPERAPAAAADAPATTTYEDRLRDAIAAKLLSATSAEEVEEIRAQVAPEDFEDLQQRAVRQVTETHVRTEISESLRLNPTWSDPDVRQREIAAAIQEARQIYAARGTPLSDDMIRAFDVYGTAIELQPFVEMARAKATAFGPDPRLLHEEPARRAPRRTKVAPQKDEAIRWKPGKPVAEQAAEAFRERERAGAPKPPSRQEKYDRAVEKLRRTGSRAAATEVFAHRSGRR
jgi:hypothetical protein